jgi:hypothetical protein
MAAGSWEAISKQEERVELHLQRRKPSLVGCGAGVKGTGEGGHRLKL